MPSAAKAPPSQLARVAEEGGLGLLGVDALPALHVLSPRVSALFLSGWTRARGTTLLGLEFEGGHKLNPMAKEAAHKVYVDKLNAHSGEEPAKRLIARAKETAFWAAEHDFPDPGRPWSPEPQCPGAPN